MVCRKGCAACCIVISINSPIPNMPFGKKAGERCINLNSDNLCMIHNTKDYPIFCKGLKASLEMCGNSNEDAFKYLAELEILTSPD